MNTYEKYSCKDWVQTGYISQVKLKSIFSCRVLLSLNNCQNRWLHIYIKPQEQNSSRFTKFHNLNISWSIQIRKYILRVYVLAAQYSKYFALFLKVTFIKEQQGKQNMYFLVSTMHIVSVKQHLSVSEGCRHPVFSSTGTSSRLITHESWGLSEADISEPEGHMEKRMCECVRSGTRHIHIQPFFNALPCQTYESVVSTDKQSAMIFLKIN